MAGTNYGEFATIKSQAGLNSFKIGVQEFVERLNEIAIYQMKILTNGMDSRRLLK